MVTEITLQKKVKCIIDDLGSIESIYIVVIAEQIVRKMFPVIQLIIDAITSCYIEKLISHILNLSIKFIRNIYNILLKKVFLKMGEGLIVKYTYLLRCNFYYYFLN